MTVWKAPVGKGPHPPWKVLLVDRDGVVILDRGYIDRPEDVELVPGAAAAMAQARAAGWFLCGVSNQSGLGRGLFGPGALESVMERMDHLLAAEGVEFDAFMFCPHAPDAGCACRKPAVGLLAEIGLVEGLDARSFVVGDKTSDVELGLNLGISPILVRTGYGRDSEPVCRARWPRLSIPVVDDLASAVEFVLGHEELKS